MKKLIVITGVFLLGTTFGTYYMPFLTLAVNCNTEKYSHMWMPLRDFKHHPFQCGDTNINAYIETSPSMIYGLLRADFAYYYYKITGKRID